MAEEDCHREQHQVSFERAGNGARDRRRASASTELGLDLLTDERTKEVLDKIGATIGDNPNLRIAVVGKTGVGKTTLIKSLFEDNVQSYDVVERTEKVDDSTFDIESPSGRQIEVVVKDTPGTDALVGIGSKTNRKQYVQAVSTSIKEADIILYCLCMDQYVSESDVGTLRFFLEEFGERVWAKVMIVLTCANKVVSEIPEEYKQQIFDSRFKNMQTDLGKAMQQAGVSEEVAKATPICVAGSPWDKSLPGCDDWVCPFLVNCLKSGVTDNTKAALLHSTWKRWITTRRKITGTATGAGVVTGLGLVVIGGVMSAHPIGLPLGVPLLAVGAGISIYSASASAAQATVSERKHSKDMETANKIQKLQPGDHP